MFYWPIEEYTPLENILIIVIPLGWCLFLSLLAGTIALVNWELARANFLSCVTRLHLRSLRVSRRLNPKMVEGLSREEQEMGWVDSVLS